MLLGKRPDFYGFVESNGIEPLRSALQADALPTELTFQKNISVYVIPTPISTHRFDHIMGCDYTRQCLTPFVIDLRALCLNVIWRQDCFIPAIT